jgi:hypothetical protein
MLLEAVSCSYYARGIVSDGQIGKIDYWFHYVHDETSNARPNNYVRQDGFSLPLDVTLSPSVKPG